MRRASIALSVLIVLGLLVVPPARGEDIDPKDVKTAIEDAISFLKKEQRGGKWPDYSQTGGVTALVTLALLNAGVPHDDEHIERAVKYLRELKPERTYTVALQTMVLCHIDARADRPGLDGKLASLVKWLVDTQITKAGEGRPGAPGGWSYPLALGDNSNSQFALLALFEAERLGYTVPRNTWELARKYWENSQNPEGSWGYLPMKSPGAGTGSMTCAGIASLMITADRLGNADAAAQGDRLNCCRSGDADPNIERALVWLGDNFSSRHNPMARDWYLYYMYGVERVGRMTAKRFIGKHDWYRLGVENLLKIRPGLAGGAFVGSGHVENDKVIATSFALLFLAKGRRPVLMAKLQHGPGDDWNRHRNDVANLTAYVEQKWKKDLTWQVIDSTKATAEDLIQAPVLFINGSKIPIFKNLDEQAKILRNYVDRGGFIFAEACCPNSEEFDRGFRMLMKKTFPEPEYRLRLLPASHPIWTADEKVAADLQRPLLCIDYGCRTSVVYAPPPTADDPVGNLSCYWELHQGRTKTFSKKIDREVTSALDIGRNVLAYATNRELKGKEESLREPKSDKPKDTVDRGKLYIAKLQHAGGCDAAPGALPSLLRAVEAQLKVRVDTEQKLIGVSDPGLMNYATVFMHGRQKFKLSAAERENLKKFLSNGGTLLVDAICANQDFANSFRDEMQAMFPKQLAKIPGSDKLYSTAFGGFDLKSVTRREPVSRDDGTLTDRKRTGPPEMEGVKLGDRYAVIFSPYDLSCALEKQDTLECEGYTRDDAERISLNVLFYALHQ